MPKTNFVLGQVFLPAWPNAMQNLVFDDQDIDGHYPRLTDDSLSSAVGNIKPQWYAFRDSLAVTVSSGLTVSIAAGSVSLETGLIATISTQTLTVSASASTYIFVDTAGTVAQASVLPVRSVPLALVVAGATTITSITDLRPRYRVLPSSRAIAAFGSGGYQGDLTISANQNLDGIQYFRNFTVNAGVTVTVPSGFLQIIASGNINIQGTINVSPPVSGGRELNTNSQGSYAPTPGVNYGGGAGHISAPPQTYPWTFSPVGSGGASGFSLINGGVTTTTSRGGNGGGACWLQAAGTISVSGAINCNGGAASIGVCATPGATDIRLGGGGGGSGGLIWMQSLTSITVTAAGSLSVRGGNGANGLGFNYAGSVVGGGGGGGGYVVLQCPSINTTGATITLTGGSIGTTQPGTPGVWHGSPGGSYAGAGGTSGISGTGVTTAGSIGLLVTQSYAPV